MKRYRRQFYMLVLTFILSGMCILPVSAARTIQQGEDVLYYSPKDKWSNVIYAPVYYNGIPLKVLSVKSSNKKVISVSISEDRSEVIQRVRKPGRANLVIKAKSKNRTYKIKQTLVVRKYKNPVKTFKVGKKDYASVFKNRMVHSIKGKAAIKGKLSIVPQKGWEISEIVLDNFKNQVYRSIRNNRNINLKRGQNSLSVCFQNKQTDDSIWIALTLD